MKLEKKRVDTLDFSSTIPSKVLQRSERVSRSSLSRDLHDVPRQNKDISLE